jgi:hypothetical protein
MRLKSFHHIQTVIAITDFHSAARDNVLRLGGGRDATVFETAIVTSNSILDRSLTRERQRSKTAAKSLVLKDYSFNSFPFLDLARIYR